MTSGVDLGTSYLGLHLRSPLVASAGPLSGEVDGIVDLERAGAGAIVLPSLFEEQIEHETAEVDRLLASDTYERWASPSRSPFDLAEYNRGVDDYLDLIEAAKSSVDVPVIASLNGANIGGWLRHAHLLADAGADAIELNLFAVAADPARAGATLESEQLGLVSLVTGELDVPLAIKISPFYSSLSNFLVEIEKAGADGVTMFNRFSLPEIDRESAAGVPRATLSTPAELRLPLHWTSIMRRRLSMSIAVSSGVHSGFDAVKSILAGADVVMTTSALLRYGINHLAEMETELRSWMTHRGHRSLPAVRGSLCREMAADPELRERASYIATVVGHTRGFRSRQP